MTTILDLTVILRHTSVSNCFLVCAHYCFVCYYRSSDIYIYAFFTYSSIHLWGIYAVTQLLANHSTGHLLQSRQSMPTQTGHFDEGGQNRTENSLLLLNYVFYVKILITLHCKKKKEKLSHLKIKATSFSRFLSSLSLFFRRFSTCCCINLKQQVEKTQISADAGCL